MLSSYVLNKIEDPPEITGGGWDVLRWRSARGLAGNGPKLAGASIFSRGNGS